MVNLSVAMLNNQRLYPSFQDSRSTDDETKLGPRGKSKMGVSLCPQNAKLDDSHTELGEKSSMM